MDELSQLDWLKEAQQIFSSQLASDSVAHAQLLGLEAGYGAELLLNHFASLALCDKPSRGRPCGFCRACHLVEANNHPDLHIVKPDGQQIKVDQIRHLCHSLVTTAQQGGRRVAIIYHSEKMNIAAANALLKTLEEPGDDTLLLLQTDTPSLLMPTISSRCQKINVHIPSKQQINVWLQANSQIKSDMSWCMPIVGGPLELIQALNSGYYQLLLGYRKAWSDSIQQGHLHSQLLEISEQEIVDVLNVYYLVLRQLVLQSKFADALHQAQIINLANEVMETRQRLSMMNNVNPAALCQQLMLKYRHIANG
ncbi:MAG: DNA polymerase III subunit delta' [Parashewanella sp.]